MITNLICIAFIIVFGIDYSGFVRSIEDIINKYRRSMGKHSIVIPPPFSCGLCSFWWTGLIYLLIINQFTLLNIAIVAALAALTPVINDLIHLVIDGIQSLIYGIRKILNF